MSSCAGATTRAVDARAVNPVSAKPVPEGFSSISEGSASIIHETGHVFYNPAQVQNRDLSIACLNVFSKIYRHEKEARSAKRSSRHTAESGAAAGFSHVGLSSVAAGGDVPPADVFEEYKGLRILEGLSASGLRSIRYAKEIPDLDFVVANDMLPAAVESIQRNLVFNEIPTGKVIANLGDVNKIMLEHSAPEQRFDVVDLDPYGSASPFLDIGVQCVADGGLMCVTCTDMAVLCGAHSESCFSKYGSVAIKSKACHEEALRIVLHTVEAAASRHKRAITPLLSVHMDFYVRVFVRIHISPKDTKLSMSKTGMIYQCVGCQSHHIQSLGRVETNGSSVRFLPARGPPVASNCAECNGAFALGGPFWIDPMHDNSFLELVKQELTFNEPLYKSSRRLMGLVSSCLQELSFPWLYDVSFMCHVVGCNGISVHVFKAALLELGYQVGTSHTNPQGIKSNAPPSVLWDIIRAWVSHSEIQLKPRAPNSIACTILSRPSKLLSSLNFEELANSRTKSKESNRANGVSYIPPPNAFWGPLARPKAKLGQDDSFDDAEESSIDNATLQTSQKKSKIH